MMHFLIECKEMKTVRNNRLMTKYWEENKENMVGISLFEHDDIEETKIMLGKMWKYREERIKEMNVPQQYRGKGEIMDGDYYGHGGAICGPYYLKKKITSVW